MRFCAVAPPIPVLLVCLLAFAVLLVHAGADYYKVLGVDKSASERDIKRAYRKRAQKIHPDKHPDKAQEFIELSDAYQALSDPEVRKIYDRYGEDGVKKHQAGQGAGGRPNDPFDMFRHFFGGGGGGFNGGARRGPNKHFNVEVPLSDMYTGRTFELEYERNVVCPACDGSGARSPADIHTCETCAGRGVRIVRQQIMPGFITNAQVTCDKCAGAGRVIAHACPKCGGNKIMTDQSTLDVEIEPGMREGEELVFEGDADESPDWEAGDVVIRLRSKREQGDFRRRADNLYLTQPIGLDEALLGFEREVKHLDGHVVSLRRTGVTQPGYVQTLTDEGMPVRHATTHGSLYVEYEVVLPEKVEGDLRTAFERMFGHKSKAASDNVHSEL